MLCDNRNTELGVRTNAFNYKPTNIMGKTLTEKKLFHLLSKLFPKVGLDWVSSVLFFICIFSWFEVNRSILRIQKSLHFPIFLLYTNLESWSTYCTWENTSLLLYFFNLLLKIHKTSSLSWIEPITSSLFLACTENCSGATNFAVLRSSDATVAGSVLDFASQDEHGRQGGNGNVEEELPRVSQAEQVQVA